MIAPVFHGFRPPETACYNSPMPILLNSPTLRNVSLAVLFGCFVAFLFHTTPKPPVATFQNDTESYVLSQDGEIWVLTGSDGNHWTGRWDGSTFTGTLVGISMSPDIILRPDPKGPGDRYLLNLFGVGVPGSYIEVAVTRKNAGADVPAP